MELIIELLGRPKPQDLEAMEIAYDNNILESLSKKKCLSIWETFKG